MTETDANRSELTLGVMHHEREDRLAERPVSFDYGYNMCCPDCPQTTHLTGTEYFREDNGAHIACTACHADIHFGLAVLALRDANDPVLADEHLVRVAWYHTSTYTGWPQSSRTLSSATVESLQHTPSVNIAKVRAQHEGQALHLGTYEAAIESMLRRMNDQNDGGASLSLYRVELRRDILVEPGWRDENATEVARISQADLGEADAIRYLNVHESPGSISLAIKPAAICRVQRVDVPTGPADADLIAAVATEVAGIRDEMRLLEASRPTELSPLERLRQTAAARQGSTFEGGPTPEQSTLAAKIRQRLEDVFLPSVSDPVRHKFTTALGAWHAAQPGSVSDTDYIARFASMAAMLTKPEQVIGALNDQPHC
ncbi:hypothetical protein DMP23_43600 [Amycolatopsis sp. A1MSW2902]|uniref:hypothetical protein n=1 Tax=Amycolatopsis sp. A1MSW2902 TaxID=687413 RepID=UPI00307E5AC6